MLFHVSLQNLDDFSNEFWDYVKDEKKFAFYGPMGVGKTTIISALCRKKGVRDVIGSPTFSIINEYAYLDNTIKRLVYHIDLYRLNSKQEIIQSGVEDCIYSEEICFVEWPEKAPYLFDQSSFRVEIEQMNESERAVKINRNL